MNRLIAAAVVAVIALYLLFSSLYVVNPRQQAIVTRFGQITAVRSEPGLYFKLPTSLVDDVQIIDNRLQRYDLDNMTLQVSDGKQYVVDAFVTYRISDPRKFRERALGSLDVVEARLSARFDAALRQVYGLRGFADALSAKRLEMMNQARDLIRPDMADLGIEVVDVRILRTDLTEPVSEQTYARMKAERLAQAALLRANGQQAAQSIRAIASRQSIEIVADATKDADILRGQGDAQRSQIYALAYNADPEFFNFYRSLQAYRTGLSKVGTTMVLTPDSEFFHYFDNAGKATVPAGGVPAQSSAQPTVAPVPDVIPPADINAPTDMTVNPDPVPVPQGAPTPPLTNSDPAANNAPTPPITNGGAGGTTPPAPPAPAISPAPAN
ncbi:MAG TPA: SPFH domain-containing protein [Devosiaceae bacterium]|nr:SPFH domain-containing protein [Devosiaceae bacterium]